MSRLTIQLFGGFRLIYEEQEMKMLYTERFMLLLSYLLLHNGHNLARKQIAFTLWPDTPEDQARTNLRNLFHHLKRAFPQIDLFLDIDGQFVGWKSGAEIDLDVWQFNESLALANSTQTDVEQIQALQAAIHLYRGELLPGLYQDWILAYREELQQAFQHALQQLARLLEEHRRYEEAVEVIGRLLHADPLNESAYLRAMRLHALNEDRAGALQAYHACVTVLQRELGVEPSAEIRAFREALLQSAEGSGEAARTGRKLIGRKQEWGRVREAWSSSQRGKAHMVAILGEAGIGKTRLASELMQWTQRQGIRTAFAQCYPLEGNLPFAPVIAWLRAEGIREELNTLEPLWKKEIARLLPELEEAESASGQSWQRQRLFEALARGLIGSGAPRLLVLDDIQWSDQETLEFLHYLLRYDMSAKLLVLTTVRLEEVDEQHPLNQLRNGLLARGQIAEIELGPLNQDEVGLLANDLLGRNLNEETESRIFAETEGNPFFTVEVLRSGMYETAGPLPSTLRSVLTRRLGQLSISARDLVGLAAVIGREFNFSLLAAASQSDENALVQALDELWSRRIIQTQQGDTYIFSHGKLQDAAYDSLSAARRPLLHRRVAETLLAREGESALIASHFEKAGQYPQALEQYRKAAEEARSVFANQNAIVHLERALVLLTEKIGIKTEAQKHMVREMRELVGDLNAISTHSQLAADAYEAALEWIQPQDIFVRARVLGKLSKVISYDLDYERGTELFQQAIEALGQPTKENESEWWDLWLKMYFDRAWIEYDRNNVDKLDPILEAIQPVAERSGNPDKLGEYYFLAPLVDFRRYGYQMTEKVLRYFKLAMDNSRNGANLEVRTRGIFGYAFGQYMTAHCDDAILYFNEALKLAEQIGYVEQQIYNLTYLTGAHRRAGHIEECKAVAERSLALCEREGYRSFIATALANLGWVAWKQNDLKKAKQLSQKAVEGWSKYYPFWWYGLWTLIDLSLLALRTDDAIEYARQLKMPGQQIFAKEADDLLTIAIAAAEKGDRKRAEALLVKAVEWAKKNHYL